MNADHSEECYGKRKCVKKLYTLNVKQNTGSNASFALLGVSYLTSGYNIYSFKEIKRKNEKHISNAEKSHTHINIYL